ncbi:hypothetical protein [Streptomyces sp. NBC_01431]|uniref:hypothetical protein n=1 Tax=Streptomyces sp. NBC_01431 TaxID=2903863 RepID=UPI002E311835|nr:hypothetical protein [Streptomyces sp. NBC_01431]
MNENAHRILLVRPEPRVLHAAAELGFEAWASAAVHAEQLAAAARAHRVAHILYFGRSPVLWRAAQRASDRVFPARAQVLGRLRDPAALRRILNQSGVSRVEAVTVPSPDIARAWLEHLVPPRVVKTVDGQRSDIVRGSEGLARWAAGTPPVSCVIEELLVGPCLIVDSVSRAGMHHIVGMTGGRGATPAGVDLLYPAAPLPSRDAAAVRSVVRALLDLVGHEEGLMRTDVVLTGDGPRVAAVHLPSAADAVARLTQAATERPAETEILARLAGRPQPRREPARYAALARLDCPAMALPHAADLDVLRAMADVRDVRVVGGAHSGIRIEAIVQADAPLTVAHRLAAVRERWAALSLPGR